MDPVRFSRARPSVRSLVALLLGAAVMLLVLAAPGAQAAKAMVPGYFGAGSIWNTAIAAPNVGIIVSNVNSGPGWGVDSTHRTAINNARARGIKVIGYVFVSYGWRAQADVRADIDRWYSYYGVDGIFFDEAPADNSQLTYMTSVTNYVRAKSTSRRYTMLNPGTYPTSGYARIADNILAVETSYSVYTGVSVPSWARTYASSKFTHMVHGTPSGSYKNMLNLAAQRNAYWVYPTDDSGANPYDRLPTYWSAMTSVL